MMKGTKRIVKKKKPKQPDAPTIPATPCSKRGHTEVRLGGKMAYCSSCKLDVPKGGWSTECAKPKTPRVWMG
jgi:hypothetical protein